MDLVETGKRKMVSEKNIAIIFLIFGLGLQIIHVLLLFTNPSATLDSRFTYSAIGTFGMGFLSAGVLVAVLYLAKILERVG